MPESHCSGAIQLRVGLAVALQGWAKLLLGFLVDGKKAGQHPTEVAMLNQLSRGN